MEKVRILIADNSRDYIFLLVQFLSNYHEFEIVGVAYDGAQAIEMVRQAKPDVLLLDLIMPDTDGLAVLKRINQTGDNLHIIVMSGIGDEKLIEMVMALGVSRYFVKPACLQDVALAILEMTNRRAEDFAQ